MTNFPLPKGYEDLQAWSDWCLADIDARRDRRINSSMEDIDAFYDAVLPHMGDALALLHQTPVDKMDPASENLLNLLLTMAEIAPAVEQFHEPVISYGYDVRRYTQGVQ